jgi:hypothetical protein
VRVGECGCNMYVHPRHGWLWRRHRVRCSFSNRTCQACMYKIGRLTSCVLQKSVFVLMYSGLSSSRKSLLSFNDYCSLTGKPRDLQYADAVGQCHEIKGTVLEAILHDPASPLIGSCSDMCRRIWCLVRVHDEKECINTHQTS